MFVVVGDASLIASQARWAAACSARFLEVPVAGPWDQPATSTTAWNRLSWSGPSSVST